MSQRSTEAEMQGAVLPGNSTAEIRSYPVPEPGWGQVLLRMKSSTICGSDIRAIYREHRGIGPEGYQGVIAGHEPCGQIVDAGPGCRRFAPGDRVIIYHISGCGLCYDCRRGYMISCTSGQHRRAYGWQRDGGMAEYLLADEKDLVHLPDELSYTDGAQVACGFGTAYEGLQKIGVRGDDAVLRRCSTDRRSWPSGSGGGGALPQVGGKCDHWHRCFAGEAEVGA